MNKDVSQFSDASKMIKISLFSGALVMVPFFCKLADKYGRKIMFLSTLYAR